MQKSGASPVPGPAAPVRHLAENSWHTPSTCPYHPKCIGDDTKAAARQSPNCIKNNKNKIWRKRFSIWRMEFLHLTVWHDHELISPGDCTLQCGMWLWDDMPWNSPKCPRYWNSKSGFDFDHITAVDMSFCTSLQNFIQIGPSSAEKWCYVDFQDGGSQPSWILGVQ